MIQFISFNKKMYIAGKEESTGGSACWFWVRISIFCV